MTQIGQHILRYYYTSDGERRYIIAPNGIKLGDEVMSGAEGCGPGW